MARNTRLETHRNQYQGLIMNTIAIIQHMFPRETTITSGKIEVTCETLSNPTEILQRLAVFGGQGWYCGTDQSAIRILPADLPPPESSWPISAELVKGKESLHLTRTEQGWELAHKRQIDELDGENILIESAFLGRSVGKLRYQTGWMPQTTDNQTELRPVQYRFLGFQHS